MGRVAHWTLIAAVLGVIALGAGCAKNKGKTAPDDTSAACGAGCGEGCGAGCAACGAGCAEGCGDACGAGCAAGCAGCAEGCAGCAEGCAEGCAGCAEGCGAGCGDGCGDGCGAGTEGCAEPAPEIPANYRKRAEELAGIYTKWARMNKEPFESNGHQKMMVVTYASKSAKDTFLSGDAPYKTHSLIAKEGYKDGKPVIVWFMNKMKPPFDPENGDWWYATVDLTTRKVKNAGKISSCMECHANAKNDFVFGPPKK